MLTKIVFISDRLHQYQSFLRSNSQYAFGMELLNHSEANQRYIFRNFYELFIVDLQRPWASIPPWVREQAQQYYFHQFIFIAEKNINPLLRDMLGRRVFKVITPEEAKKDLQKTVDEVSHFFEEHQYRFDQSQFVTETPYEGLKGNHASVKRINDFIKLVSKARFAPCLISGENGTGKRLCAQLIHRANDLRDDLIFIKNCEHTTTNEFLGDLFGVEDESGIYGPVHQGLLERYAGGTVVLDHIEKIPADAQDKLLLYLEDKLFRPLGSNRVVESTTRLIALSEHNLEWFVKHQNFNSDLFFHLNAFEISLPPLRERGDDLTLLANYYLQFFNQLYGRQVTKIGLPALRLIKNYSWPGNITELKSTIESAILSNKSKEIGLEDLPPYLAPGPTINQEENYLGNCSLKEIERLHIERTLQNTAGNKSKAAGLLQISRTTLREKSKQYGI